MCVPFYIVYYFSMLCIATLGCVYCLCVMNIKITSTPDFNTRFQYSGVFTETAQLGYTCNLC